MQNPQLHYPLNRNVLEYLENEVAAGIPEIMLELIDTYISDSQSTFNALCNELAGGNAKQVEIHAHSLKSSSATFGAEILAERFKEIELLAREHQIAMIEALVERIETDLNDVIHALDVERKRFL